MPEPPAPDHVMSAVQVAALRAKTSNCGHLVKLLPANILEATPAAVRHSSRIAHASPQTATINSPLHIQPYTRKSTPSTQETPPGVLCTRAHARLLLLLLLLLGSWLPSHSRTWPCSDP
jgi:hypothetical protein